MAQRFILAKDLAAGSDSDAVLTRNADTPYMFAATGGFTGSVNIQHSPDEGTTWITLGSISNNNDLEITSPVERLRVNGAHTGSAATVYWIVESHGSQALG